MGPTIILDKSSLQSLSQSEINFLFKHYYVVVTPILIIEILGDLVKKGSKENEVKQLANKLLSHDSQINTYYKPIVISSFRGQKISMDGRAIINGGIPIYAKNGTQGIFFEEPAETIALRNWQRGIFTSIEETLAQRWRETTRTLDLEDYKQKHKELIRNMPMIKNFGELALFVEDHVSDSEPDIQLSYINYLMGELSFSQRLKDTIYERWLKEKTHLFSNFAPYAFYCFKANMIFYFGIFSDLISTKATNKIDLEYLYYLPFCQVFSSGDKLHKNICRLLMRRNQDFVGRDKLKSDLKWLSEEWDSLDEDQKIQRKNDYGNYPPNNHKSITSQLWEKHMKPWKPGMGNLLAKMTKVKQQRLVEHIKPLINAVEEYGKKNKETESKK